MTRCLPRQDDARKRRRKEFFAVALSIGNLAALAGCSASAPQQRTSFVVSDVISSPESCTDVAHEFRALACHRLYAGERVALIVRNFSPSDRIDQSAFEKLTIVFPSLDRGDEESVFDAYQLVLAYSQGASNRPGKSDCYAEMDSGQVRVRQVGDDYRFNVDLEFDTTSQFGKRSYCGRVDLDLEVVPELVGYERLSSWEGRANEGDDALGESRPD